MTMYSSYDQPDQSHMDIAQGFLGKGISQPKPLGSPSTPGMPEGLNMGNMVQFAKTPAGRTMISQIISNMQTRAATNPAATNVGNYNTIQPTYREPITPNWREPMNPNYAAPVSGNTSNIYPAIMVPDRNDPNTMIDYAEYIRRYGTAPVGARTPPTTTTNGATPATPAVPSPGTGTPATPAVPATPPTTFGGISPEILANLPPIVQNIMAKLAFNNIRPNETLEQYYARLGQGMPPSNTVGGVLNQFGIV